MLGIKFWNSFIYRNNEWSDVYTSQYHIEGNGWYTPEFNYYNIGDGYYVEYIEDYDVNCIYEIS